MTNGSSYRLDRIERILEGLAQNQGQVVENQKQIIQTQGQIIQSQGLQQEQIQTLVSAALNHESRIARQDALIERLDAIIERLVYREGRGNGDQPQL